MVKLSNVSRGVLSIRESRVPTNAFSCTATSTDIDSLVEVGSHADNNNSFDSEIRKGDILGTISGSIGRHFFMVGKSDEEPLCCPKLDPGRY